MLRHVNKMSVWLVVAVVVVSGSVAGTAVAQKDGVTKTTNAVALGEDSAKQFLPLVDADDSGKVSKQQWMSFMEAEFDRLDSSKTGKVDTAAAEQSKEKLTPFARSGK